MKYILVVCFSVLVCLAEFDRVSGDGECGQSSPDFELLRLAPCREAAQDETAQVSRLCCNRIKQVGKNPSCLCAVMRSDAARENGVNPVAANTIPERCGFRRPPGFNC